MTTKSRLADDLLTGAEEMADHIGWPVRRVNHFIAEGRLPVKRIGKLLIARKSQLDRMFSADDEVA